MQKQAQANKAIHRISQLLQSPRFRNNKYPSCEVEKILQDEGFFFVAGIDEAGRGAFAGPLVAAAVVLSKEKIDGLNDSKKLSKKKRELLAQEIKAKSKAWAVGEVNVEFINSYGIQKASYRAYKLAVANLGANTDFVLIDYYEIPDFSTPQLGIKFGDQISSSVAAASIIAKTHRDSLMDKMSLVDGLKQYHFSLHKGYGTKLHREAIETHGLSPQHRLLYCKNCINRSKEKL